MPVAWHDPPLFWPVAAAGAEGRHAARGLTRGYEARRFCRASRYLIVQGLTMSYRLDDRAREGYFRRAKRSSKPAAGPRLQEVA